MIADHCAACHACPASPVATAGSVRRSAGIGRQQIIAGHFANTPALLRVDRASPAAAARRCHAGDGLDARAGATIADYLYTME